MRDGQHFIAASFQIDAMWGGMSTKVYSSLRNASLWEVASTTEATSQNDMVMKKGRPFVTALYLSGVTWHGYEELSIPLRKDRWFFVAT